VCQPAGVQPYGKQLHSAAVSQHVQLAASSCGKYWWWCTTVAEVQLAMGHRLTQIIGSTSPRREVSQHNDECLHAVVPEWAAGAILLWHCPATRAIYLLHAVRPRDTCPGTAVLDQHSLLMPC
jgi:hypothetical protein